LQEDSQRKCFQCLTPRFPVVERGYPYARLFSIFIMKNGRVALFENGLLSND